METVKDASESAKREGRDGNVIRVEVERAGTPESVSLEFGVDEDVLEAVRRGLALDADDVLFERDKDDPLDGPVKGRKALRLVVHKAKRITVQVRYEHLVKEEEFPPSKTVFKVLQWAVGKKGFNLDPTVAAKANLILPGAQNPLPRDAVIGSFTQPGERVLVLDLTLQDFTNG